MGLDTEPLDLEFVDEPVTLSLRDRILVPSVRLRREIMQVAMDPESHFFVERDAPVYYMYRGLARPEDADLFRRWKIRFDLTMMPPSALGPEFAKTAGHYHPVAKEDMTYPELYQVLVGEAHFLLQKPGRPALADALLVRARAGDKLIIPPDHGHVTINPGKRILVMSNLVSSDFESIYEPYRIRRGAAYYELTDGSFVMNPRYGVAPPLRFGSAANQESPLPLGNIYGLFVHRPELMVFLNDPRGLTGMRLTFG